MTWVPLLLADASPALRRLVLRDLLHRGENDPEVRELEALLPSDPHAAPLLRAQQPDGSWRGLDHATSTHTDAVRATSHALLRLGYLGFRRDDTAVTRGAEYLFGRQRKDGAWPMPCRRPNEDREEGYSMIPLQTALPLRALAICGFAEDARSERAYDWLINQRLDDGAWPTGKIAGTLGGVGGYRRLAHSRWGCRTNTTAAASCLALHPARRRAEENRRAVDLLLGRETRDRNALGFETARTVGFEPARGYLTYHARYDLGLVLDLCVRAGADRGDSRIEDLIDFVTQSQGPHGLWEYLPQPQATRWISFDLLRSLDRLGDEGEWVSTEPRTPFQAYPTRRKRF